MTPSLARAAASSGGAFTKTPTARMAGSSPRFKSAAWAGVTYRLLLGAKTNPTQAGCSAFGGLGVLRTGEAAEFDFGHTRSSKLV